MLVLQEIDSLILLLAPCWSLRDVAVVFAKHGCVYYIVCPMASGFGFADLVVIIVDG